MWRFVFWGLAMVLFMGIATSCKTVQVAGECPESQGLRCMTRKICQMDEKRGCQRCSCQSTWRSDPYDAVKRAEGSDEP